MYVDMLEQTKGTLEIILYLDENVEQRPEISRIIADLGIPRQSCYTALYGLVDAGLVSSIREKGRPPKVYCKLTERGGEVANSLRAIENKLGSTIEGYRRQLNDLRRERKTRKDKKKYYGELLTLLRKLERECYNCGQWDDAIEHGKEIIKLCQKFKDKEGLAEALRNIGSIYQKRQRFEEALEYFKKSLEAAKAINDYKGMALDYYNRGAIFERKGNYSKALKLYNRCEEYATKSSSDIERARAYLGRGRILAQKGLYMESVEVMKEALGIFKRTESMNDLLKTYTSLGSTEFYIDIDRAIKWHEKCIDLAEKMNNQRMLGYSLSNAAGCYIEKGEFKTAKQYLYRALPIFQKLNDRIMITSIFTHYGYLYRLKRQWSDSNYYLSKALKIAQAIRMPSKIADVKLMYGLMYKDRGNDTKAKRNLKSALKIFKELGETAMSNEVKKELEELTLR